MDRRAWLGTTATFLGGTVLGASLKAATPVAKSGPEISLFTKHLVGLPYEPLAEVVAKLGFDGIEAPVRPGGHVEPERVVEELPKLVAVLKQHGLRITMLTTGINTVSPSTHTELVLKTAKQLGIERYRMNWYMYDEKKPIWAQLDEIRPKLRDLVALSREIGILPCYQNHSGAKYVGAGIWDMALLMKEYPATDLAWSFDIMHATVEGSTSWPTELALVRDHLAMAYFKNFAWDAKEHHSVPLAEGVVGPSYVNRLKSSGFQGPLSLHVEYLKGGLTDPHYLEEATAATAKDLATLRSWWA
jgi:sugar phosphate isomerase/epimerase